MKIKIPIALVTFILLLPFVSMKAQVEILKIDSYLATNGAYAGGTFQAAVVVQLTEPWHINSARPTDEFVIATELRLPESDQYSIDDIQYPPHKMKTFSFYDEALAVYEDEIIIIVSGTLSNNISGTINLNGRLYYQGCNDQVCLPPAETKFSLEIPILANSESVQFQHEEYFGGIVTTDKPSSDTFDIGDSFARKGIIVTFFLIFLGGLGLNLTPCVYPLIPITMSYFGGQTAGKSGKRLLLAILYVLGIAIVNSALGTLAALTGGLLGSSMTNPIVLISIAGILIALSLSMFGVYEFGVPSVLMNLGSGSRTGYFGALVMGLTMGIVAAPCIGPFVIGLLTYVASTGNPFIGFSMFFTLSLGLGIPFIFLAFFSSKIDNLPRSGEWMVGVRIIFGLILVGMALYFIHPLIPEKIYSVLFPAYMISSGVYLLVFNTSGEKTRGFLVFKKLVAIIAIILGTWFLKPESSSADTMAWQPYQEDIYNNAIKSGKPLIIDFYADWCIPCKEMDKFTFTDPAVIDLSRQFHLLKVDLTSSASPEVIHLKNKFDIKGVPSILFIDKKGNELSELRTLGFEKPELFLTKMNKTLSK
ncbi:MAG: thioredoxin family protein [Candidatus Marinimicrobia bacterium]|nr:thioredoxin family protein [Candidatus Neomarinimicrobiota bacterium]